MTVQYCSDLHLEFPENWKYLQKKPLPVIGEILLLAGDIIPFALIDKFNDFINYLSDHFDAIYWIPGNHEYYQSNIPTTLIGTPALSLFEKIRDNFFLVNNHQLHHKNRNLVFSTLWSPVPPDQEWELRRSIADYRTIKIDERSLTPVDINALYNECRLFLETTLANSKTQSNSSARTSATMETTIIVTHHVPTLLNYPPQYKNSPLSGAFAVELFDLIENSGAGYWIYGHHHVNTPSFRIGQTEMLTNQLGYIRMNEQRKFRPGAVIDLS